MKRYILLKEYYKELFSYKGRKIADIEHSVSQFRVRHPGRSIEEWKKVIEDGIDVILDVFNDSAGKYIIISKSKNIAVQLEWRLDNKYNDKKNHGFTATTLNYDTQKKVIQNDTKLFVEDFKKYNIEENIKDVGYYTIDICKNYKIYIKEGKINRNFEIIKVK